MVDVYSVSATQRMSESTRSGKRQSTLQMAEDTLE